MKSNYGPGPPYWAFQGFCNCTSDPKVLYIPIPPIEEVFCATQIHIQSETLVPHCCASWAERRMSMSTWSSWLWVFRRFDFQSCPRPWFGSWLLRDGLCRLDPRPLCIVQVRWKTPYKSSIMWTRWKGCRGSRPYASFDARKKDLCAHVGLDRGAMLKARETAMVMLKRTSMLIEIIMVKGWSWMTCRHPIKTPIYMYISNILISHTHEL